MSSNFYATSTWNDLRDRVLIRDNKTCQYCGAPASQVDHIRPRHISQDDSESNLVAVCRPCNRWFLGKSFDSYEEKLSYYKEHSLGVWNEFLERVAKKEARLGRPLSTSQKRNGRISMIKEGKTPIPPHARAYDHICETCAETASVKTAREKGWPTKTMCHTCAIEAGVPLKFEKHQPVLKIDKYEDFLERESDPLYRRCFELLIKEERAKVRMTDDEKLRWNISNADVIEEVMLNRRVCRECGVKTESYEYVDGLPYCKDGKHGYQPRPLADNVDWFIDEEIEKKPKWNPDGPKNRKLAASTRPDSFLPEEVVKNLKSREERRAWNLEHAEWLELTMSMQRVCRSCGIKTGYYDLIEGVVTCVSCQRRRNYNDV